MKLTSPRHPVKPDPRVLGIAAVTTALALAGVALILTLTDRQASRTERFGHAATASLAELVVEPLMQGDRLHLGVIGNRLAAMPEIVGVASFSADDRLLATTGGLNGRRFRAPVTIDDNVVGYVEVALDPRAFAEGGAARILSLLALALLTPMAVAMGWALIIAVRRGELALVKPVWPWRGRIVGSGSAAADAEAGEAGAGEPEPAAEPADICHYLLAVNLYNQLTLTPDAREFEQTLCGELAERVAELYQGQVVSLPGVGTLVDFDHTDDPDRPFQVVCAAFLLIRLLNHEAPFGRYRLGINVAVHPEDQALPMDDPAVADAALLSALARNGTLALSAPFSRVLAGEGRLASQPLHSPLLDELACGSSGCCLVTGLEPPFAALLAQQADQLEAERDTTSNSSTF